MTEQPNLLYTRDVLKPTYELLVERHDPEIVTFERRASAEIGDDSDYHRTRVGYMGYDSVGLFDIGERRWAIGYGEHCGHYPGREFLNDIMALEVSPDTQDAATIADMITRSSYFRNSLVIAHQSSVFMLSENNKQMGDALEAKISPSIQEYVVQDREVDNTVLSLDSYRPIVTQSTQYSQEIVPLFADSIEQVLREAE